MDIGTQAVIAALISVVLGRLKKASWFPWLTADTSKLNRLAAIALSGLGAVGVHFAWSSANHSLLITGLSWLVLWEWAKQIAITHGWYKLTNGQLLETLQQILGSRLRSRMAGTN